MNSETRIRQCRRVSRVGYVSDTDTARIRIRGVSAYPRLNGPKTEEWIRILAIDTARPKLLHGGRGGTARLTGGGARARRGRGQGRGAAAPRSPCGLLLLPLGHVGGGSRREEDGGGRPRSHGGARHLPPHLPPSLLAGRARRSVRPRCAGWCAMEGEQTEQGRCAVERGADGAAAPPSPARFGRGKVSSTLPGGGSGPSGDGSGPAWSRARGGGRVAAVALGVGL